MDTKSKKFDKSLISKTIAFLLAVILFAVSVTGVVNFIATDFNDTKDGYISDYLFDSLIYDADFHFEASNGFINLFSENVSKAIQGYAIYADGSKNAYTKYRESKPNRPEKLTQLQLKNLIGKNKTGSPLTILCYIATYGDSLLTKVGEHKSHYNDYYIVYDEDYCEFYHASNPVLKEGYEYEDEDYYNEYDEYEDYYETTMPERVNFINDIPLSGQTDSIIKFADEKYQSKNKIPDSVRANAGKNDYLVELCNCYTTGTVFDGYYKINVNEISENINSRRDLFEEDYLIAAFPYYFDSYNQFKSMNKDFQKEMAALKNLTIVMVDNKTGIAHSNRKELDGKKLTKDKLNELKKATLFYKLNLANGEKDYKLNSDYNIKNRYVSYADSLTYQKSIYSDISPGTFINGKDYYDNYDATVYAAFYGEMNKVDCFSKASLAYSNLNSSIKDLTITLSVSLLLMLLCIVYLVIRSGRKSGDDELHMMKADKIFTLLRIAINAGLIFLLVLAVLYISDEIIRTIHSRFLFNLIGLCAATAMALLIDLILYIARNIKNQSLIKNILIVKIIIKIFEKIKAESKYKSETYRDIFNDVVRKLVLYVVVPNFIAGVSIELFSAFEAFIASWLISVILFVYDILVVVYMSKYAYYIREISLAVSKIRGGDYSIRLNPEKMPSSVKSFANDINSLTEGLRIAVDNAIKDERMKTELITNVSHDLKTPLTSIINYTDLLSRCDITDEAALSYIEVLSEKSARLKKLIEDLVDASKASSGAIKVELTGVSLNELTAQIVGEYSDYFESRQLEMIVSESHKNIIVSADSKLAYRAFDNLMSNIRKYAMPCTRVYLDLSVEDGFGVITLKNVSEGKLNIPAEELMERFVRADSSRSTEGSGLGLSIAQNLCTLQGGSLSIAINGDLFEAKIRFQLNSIFGE